MKVGPLVAALVLSTGMAGCLEGIGLGGSATGTLSVLVHDNTNGVVFEVDGIYAKEAGNEGGWALLNEEAALWSLDGDETMDPISGDIAVGAYDLLQVTFHNVTDNGEAAILTESGFVLPVDFNIADGGETVIEIGFAWGDALFQSQQGLAFAPALKSLVVTEDGTETVNMEAADIDQGPTKAPVARMRVLDEVWEIWQSDFLAESAGLRKKGTAGNLTFLASESEALAPGATLESYMWTFDDGMVLEGKTVNRVYDLNGGNFSVLLTVTDSNGVSDTQNLEMALQPGKETASLPYRVEALQGLTASGECTMGEKSVEFEIDPTTTPSGSPAGVAEVVTTAVAQAPHPSARIHLRVFDGEGNAIGTAAGGSVTQEQVDRTATKKFDPAGAQPVGGTWTVTVQPCKAFDLDVAGKMTINWQGVGEPEFLLWYAEYDDGENR